MKNVSIKNIDDYLALQPEPKRTLLENLRQTITKCVPDAEEVISYQMPALKYKKRILVYFAAFKNHCSLFVGNGTLIQSVKNELKAYETTKGSIHFTSEKPLPKTLIKKLIQARVREIELKNNSGKTKKR